MKGKERSILRTINAYAVLAVLSFFCLFFFYILIVNSSRNNFQIQQGFSARLGKSLLINFKNVINDANTPVLTGFWNSFLIAALSTTISCYFSALTAYGLYAYKFKLQKPAFVFIMLIMTMPSQVTALGFIEMITKFGWLNTILPLVVPSIAAPAVFYFMYSYLQSTLPMELIEAARIDGSGEFHTFNSIVLPILKPAIAVQAIFGFVGSWNNYFMPALVLTDRNKKTMPILIATLRSADFMKFDIGKVYMLIAIAIVPIIVIYLFLSKYIVAGVTLGGVKE